MAVTATRGSTGIAASPKNQTQIEPNASEIAAATPGQLQTAALKDLERAQHAQGQRPNALAGDIAAPTNHSAPSNLGWATAPTKDVDVLRPATLDEISAHLVGLGAGNQTDNVKSLRGASTYVLTRLSQDAFLNLVFLANDEVRPIVPADDRRLRAVAARAHQAGALKLSDNWDLGRIAQNFEAKGPHFPPIVLRDARDSETAHGARFYIQDGSHRSLAYAMALLAGTVSYEPVEAYVATSKSLS